MDTMQINETTMKDAHEQTQLILDEVSESLDNEFSSSNKDFFGSAQYILWHPHITKQNYIEKLLEKIDLPKKREMEIHHDVTHHGYNRIDFLLGEISKYTGYNFENTWERPIAETIIHSVVNHARVITRNEMHEYGTRLENIGFETIGFSYRWYEGASWGPQMELVYASPNQLEKIKKGRAFKQHYLHHLDRQIDHLEKPKKSYAHNVKNGFFKRFFS